MKRVSIVGLGYIGLPTAIIAAECGYDVFGFDINPEKVKRINEGDPTILETDIQSRLKNTLRKKRFRVSTNLEYADCFVITVPTPFKNDRSADLQYVFDAGEQIAKRLMPGNLIILESTVPVGTTEKLGHYIEDVSDLRLGIDFFIAHCPERSIPGRIFKELIENDRVIGGLSQKACDLAYLFYSKFVKGFLHITDDKTAEMVKLVENSSRDVQIAFANQVAAMSSEAGIDPYQVIELANKHPRVNVLSPTCGVGGHCIAVDPLFLIESFPQSSKLLKTAREINDQKPYTVIKRLLARVEELKENGHEKPKVLALGLTFKPNVDDTRESPALKIAIDLCKEENIEFSAYDPFIDSNKVAELGIPSVQDIGKELRLADIVLVLVKHTTFLSIPEEIFCSKVIVDTCGLLHDMHKKQSRSLLSGTTRTMCNFENVTF